MARYRVTINGFWCHSESWDDPFNWDGKHDEVFLSVSRRTVNAAGVETDSVLNSESELMGDTWRQPNRVQAGSASNRGGLITGDKFPSDTPWIRPSALNGRRVPPYTIWEGELPPGELMVLLTPTIWEWDPGDGLFNQWLEWQVGVDAEYGKRAKDIFGKILPVAAPVFDAVSLGIQTVGSMAGLWSPLGRAMRRPIGLQRDPNNADGMLFNPITIALNSETAEFMINDNPQGLGNGIRGLLYRDDQYLRGAYSIFIQVDKVSSDISTPSDKIQPDWRICGKCKALYFGLDAAHAVCPSGSIHEWMQSGNYLIPHSLPPNLNRQVEWRFCNKCHGLYYGPGISGSVCPAGETHSHYSQSGSFNYTLPYGEPSTQVQQSDWRWCNRCQGLYFGLLHDTSTCPTGGPHALAADSFSFSYTLPFIRFDNMQ